MEDLFEVELSEWKLPRVESKQEKEHTYYEYNESGLSFAGSNLPASHLLQDVEGYILSFHAGTHEGYYDGEESWANPLRASVLQSLTSDSTRWYLSFHTYLAKINILPFQRIMQHRFIIENRLNFIVVHSDEWTRGIPNRSRLFFEVPNAVLAEMVSIFWSGNWKSTTPFEGYLLPPGRLDLLADWDRRRRDDKLLRDVLDRCSMAFYTFPSENRHFGFVTSKYTLEDFKRIVELRSLQKSAKEIGHQIIKSKS